MAAARITPELYDEIFSAGKDEHDLVRHYEDTTARRRTLQYLSGFASVGIYWANLVRPRMFQILVLRSARDFYGLLALLRMPCSSRIRPISHCLRAVAVFYRLEDYFWCHDLERLQTNLVHEDFHLYVHISGRTPRVRNNEPRAVRHPLFSTLPRKIPFHWRGLRYVDLIIEKADFPDGAGLLNLIRDISYSGIIPRSIRCDNLIWNDDTHLASLDSTFSLNQHLHIEPFDVTTMNCTDNFLAAFTTHIYLGRRGSVPPLSSSDAEQFLGIFSEWARLACDAGLRHEPIISRVFLAGEQFWEKGNSHRLKADQDATGYLWRINTSRDKMLFFKNPSLQFGCYYMRPEQGQGPGTAQMAHISSIAIGVYHADMQLNWNIILRKALDLPLLDTIEVRLHGRRDTLRTSYAGFDHKLLVAAESQGRLRLFFSLVETLRVAYDHEHWRQATTSDVGDILIMNVNSPEGIRPQALVCEPTPPMDWRIW